MKTALLEPLADLYAKYPSLSGIAAEQLADDLEHGSESIEVSADAQLFDEGAPCRGSPLVLEGEIRVARGSRDGRSVELNRVSPGEACVVSTAALTAGRPLLAHGSTTLPTRS